jgi:hypothetical protein
MPTETVVTPSTVKRIKISLHEANALGADFETCSLLSAKKINFKYLKTRRSGKYQATGRRSRVASTTVSYSGVPGSNFYPQNSYPEWQFSEFSTLPPGECRDSTFK